ncbi:CLUMA_CG013486, isoform A [Clunio marinus]|uniref:CLUMA_CG013486, isoform A n=1 Tax=Clunio marinus TaxID=568069 RepID=A0A1J1IKY2_9DIPT|nr:CLUMA_CG013486, isoform A [Clunio marinus]
MTEIEATEIVTKEEEDRDEEESVYSDPNVAVIVSFLDQFGTAVFPDKPPVMSDLMDWISNTDEVSPELQDIHVKLLRKLKRSVNAEKWEKAIIKFCYFYGGADDAFEVERYGYLHSNLGAKLRILKNLLEGQFDVNVKFKNLINAKPSTELRLEPFGKDKDGNVYYCQMDEKANIKIYQENLDEESWSVVAGNREELAKLIEELKGYRPIRPLPKDLIDEDSSSNSRPSEKEEVKVNVTEPIPDQEYSIDNASDEFPLKQTIRLIKKPDAVPVSDVKEEEIKEDTETQIDEKEREMQEKAIQKKRRRK